MVKTEAFDAARYLGSAEAQGELLNDALESGSAGYVAAALGVIARARGMGEVARAAWVAREALYRSLSEAGDLRLSTLLGVMGRWGAAGGGGGVFWVGAVLLGCWTVALVGMRLARARPAACCDA